MLAPFKRELCLRFAIRAFQPQHHFLRSLGFFVEDRFRLPTIPGLFAVIAAFSLGDCGGLVLNREGSEEPERRICDERLSHFSGFVLRDWWRFQSQ